jgi:hypothetical protein
MKNKTQFLAYTAMLLALTIVFQNLRLLIGTGFHSQLIIGSLVNAALVIAVGIINIYAGLIISIIAPIVAYAQSQIPPIFPYLIPIIAVGNALIVICYNFFKDKKQYLGIIIGALLKWAFLYYGVTKMLNIVKGTIPDNKFDKIAATLSFGFSWPQLITALVGGFIAIIVIKNLKKVLKNNYN